MQNAPYILERFAEELRDFVRGAFGIDLRDAMEDPHVLAFLDHCVERPHLCRLDGGRIRGPVRTTLPDRISLLTRYSRQLGLEIQLTGVSLTHARQLAALYEKRNRGARACSPQEFLTLVEGIDERVHAPTRLKASLLGIPKVWARPSELLRRIYPDQVSADYDEGIVFIVPQSKTNPGPEPEYLGIAHEANERLCAACAMREHRDWLLKTFGEDYRGPFFPRLHGLKGARPTVCLTSGSLSAQIKKLARRCGIPAEALSSYTLRKAPATAAAIRGHSIEDIMAGLRQRSITHTIAYIDFDERFALMKSVLEYA